MIFVSPDTIAAKASQTGGNAAYAYACALNDAMLRYGVVSCATAGESIANTPADGVYPNGVVYADTIDFDSQKSPYLVIFRADAENRCACADIFGFDEASGAAVPVFSITRAYTALPGASGQFTIGNKDGRKYIIYNEYAGSEKTGSEYYTIIDGSAYKCIYSPDYCSEAGVLSFNNDYLHPETDVSAYNEALGACFLGLRNTVDDNLDFREISSAISDYETARIEAVLGTAAGFYRMDIRSCRSLQDCSDLLASPDFNSSFYVMTALYDLGDEIYYARFATDYSFYNYAMLRRTDTLPDGYQLLCSYADIIPLTATELSAMKDDYLHSSLTAAKAKSPIAVNVNDAAAGSGQRRGSVFAVPKLIDPALRKPAALIGSGVCFAMFMFLWVYMASYDD